jgi:hypothetical protein
VTLSHRTRREKSFGERQTFSLFLLSSPSKSNRASHDLHLEFRNSGVLPALLPECEALEMDNFSAKKLPDRKFASRAVPFIEGDGG